MAASVRNTAIKRIQGDVREMMTNPSDQYAAAPLETNMFDWHFTLRGPRDTEFEGGIYHGRILLPSDYPFKPPNIMLLTPNGRFEVRKKICLSISAYHPEEWQPAWGVRLILEALISFMPTKGEGAIGALDFPAAERKRLAKLSVDYKCDTCGRIVDLLPELEQKDDDTDGEEGVEKKPKDAKPSKYAAQIAQLHIHSLEGSAPSTSTATNEEKPAGGNASDSSSSNDATLPSTQSENVKPAAERSSKTEQARPAESKLEVGEAPSTANSDSSEVTAARSPIAPEDISTSAATAPPAEAPAEVPAAVPAPRVNVEAPVAAHQAPQARESDSVDVFLHYLTVALVVALFAMVYKKLLQMHGVLQ